MKDLKEQAKEYRSKSPLRIPEWYQLWHLGEEYQINTEKILSDFTSQYIKDNNLISKDESCFTRRVVIESLKEEIKELKEENEKFRETKPESQIIVESLAHERHVRELKAELQELEETKQQLERAMKTIETLLVDHVEHKNNCSHLQSHQQLPCNCGVADYETELEEFIEKQLLTEQEKTDKP